MRDICYWYPQLQTKQTFSHCCLSPLVIQFSASCGRLIGILNWKTRDHQKELFMFSSMMNMIVLGDMWFSRNEVMELLGPERSPDFGDGIRCNQSPLSQIKRGRGH